MKVFCTLVILLGSQMLAVAQSFSCFYPLADTLALQTSYWAVHNGVLYNYRNVFGYGKNDPFNVFDPGITVSQIGFEGNINWSRHNNESAISSKPFYQVFSANPVLLFDNIILGAALFRNDDFAQRGIVFSWDLSGEPQWQYAPAPSNGFFVGDQLVKIPNSSNFYFFGIEYSQFIQRIVGYEMSQTGQSLDSVVIEIPEMSNNDREYSVINAVLGDDHLTIALSYIDFTNFISAKMLLRCTPEGQVLWHKTFVSPYYWAMLPFEDKICVNETIIPNNLSSVKYCQRVYDAFGGVLANHCTELLSPTDTTVVETVGILPHPNSKDYYVIGNQFSLFSSGKTYGFVERHDEAGGVVWKKLYFYNTVDTAFYNGFTGGAFIAPSGDIFISGSGFKEGDPTVPPYGISAVWALSIDENGCFNNDCSDTVVVHSTLISKSKELPGPGEVKLYPNPATRFFQIEIPDEGSCSVQIYDFYGRLVYSNHNYSNLQIVSTNNLAEGLYFVRISKNNSPKAFVVVKKIAVTQP